MLKNLLQVESLEAGMKVKQEWLEDIWNLSDMVLLIGLFVALSHMTGSKRIGWQDFLQGIVSHSTWWSDFCFWEKCQKKKQWKLLAYVSDMFSHFEMCLANFEDEFLAGAFGPFLFVDVADKMTKCTWLVDSDYKMRIDLDNSTS